jgi:two-component system LytT family response regulator
MCPHPVIKVLIVDDEEPARKLLRRLLQNENTFKIVGEASNGNECLKKIRQLKPDLLFLDIQMPELNGMEVLKELEEPNVPYIVFVTAYDEYALSAFEYHALDYLLKPFKKSRFDSCLEHVKERLTHKSLVNRQPRLKYLLQYYQGKSPTSKSDSTDRESRVYLKRVFVDSAAGQTSLETAYIEFIEAAGEYSRIHARGKTHLISKSLSWFELELDPSKFQRIHRSHLVNLSFISSFSIDSKEGHTVLLNSGRTLKISRRRVATIKKLLVPDAKE